MGGKARTLFGTLLGLAAAAATIGVGTGAVAAWVAGWTQITAVVYGGWAAKEARRKAEQAAKSSEGRKTTIRGGAVAKYYVYGADWVPGVVAGHREPQSKSDPYFWLVLALPIAHQIERIEHICFGDEVITPLTADGSARPGPFNKEFVKTDIVRGIVPANRIITVQGREEDRMESIEITGNIQLAITRPTPTIVTGEDTYQDVINPDATATKISATQIQIGAEPGQQYTITYSYKFTRAYIKCWTYLGTDDQVANQELINATAHLSESSIQKWRATDKLQGVPYIILRFHVDKDVFPNLLENISILPVGKRILDTRDGVERWSNNPALCARDYVINECGVLPGEVLPNARATDQFHDQVNYCDVDVPIWLPDGSSSTEPRYRTNIALSTEAKPIDNLGLLLSTCDGSAVPSGSSFDIRVGCYEEPVIELDDSDFAGPPEVVKGLSRLELFNGVRSRFHNAMKPFWPLEDAPAYISEFYKAKQGGREVVREIDLMGTVSPYMAHRICKQTLLRAMSGLRLKAMFNTTVMQLAPEQTVRLNVRSLGMEDKVFRIKGIKPDGLHRWELDLQEDGPLLYEWDFDEAAGVDPTPNTNLPSVRDVPLIQGLAADTSLPIATFGPNGLVRAQCRVSWAPVTNMLVLNGGHIEIRHKRTQDSGWTYSPRLEPTTREYRFPVVYGDVLIIGARCANSFVAGQWTDIKKVADDAPTEFLNSGNRIENSRFSWSGGPQADQYVFSAWTKWQNDGSTTTQGGGFFPFLQTQSAPWAGAVVVAPFGNPLTGWIHWIESERMPVTPGSRMVGYAYVLPLGSEAFLNVHWYGRNGDHIGHVWTPTIGAQASTTLYGQWPVLHFFMDVPSNAYIAHFTITMRVLSTSTSLLYVREPFFGLASKNQFSLPPWSA